MSRNGPAILAELGGEWWLRAIAAALAAIAQPTPLVTAADSPPALREPTEALATALARVGHPSRANGPATRRRKGI